MISKLKSVCIPVLRNLENKEHVELDYLNGLPEEVDTIFLRRYDNLHESVNSQPEGGPVADLTIEHLKSILLKKERKIKSYAHCDKYWLLIKEGNYYAGTFGNVTVVTPLTSSFDKVFLLRTKSDELFELK